MAAPLKFHLLAIFLVLPYSSSQLEFSQSQALDRIKQQFNYPQALSRWSENQDFCNTEPTQSLTLACYEGNITQLHFTGNSQEWVVPLFTPQFSTSDLFSNLASLPSLKVLSLTFLNLTGTLPPEIGGLTSLEMLNLSSNSFSGPIPQQMTSMWNLQTLILDYNGITGTLPQWIGSFPELRILSLKNNLLSGSFPDALSRVETLRDLVLSGNNLSGEVPGFNRLLNLQVLDLGNNDLGPKFPSLPTKLVSLILRRNGFHSAVPDELSACYQLQRLDVSLNQLVGTFPPSIFALPSLTYLDIGGNKFTGKLLQNMSCNSQLMFVNLTGNRLTGDLPGCLHHGVKDRIVTYDGNCISGHQKQLPLPFCHSEALAVGISPHKRNVRGASYGKTVLASSIVGGIAGTSLLLGLAFLFVKRSFLKQKRHVNEVPHTRLTVDKVSPAYTLQLLKDARYISKTKMLGTLGLPPYRTYVLDELKEATRNFSPSNLIGEGSYGQVYKGFLTDGTIVCIRSLKLKRKQSMQSCTPQLELIAKLRHGHLISSMGHCTEFCQDNSNEGKIYLVFEYVANGKLRKYVSDPKSGHKFTWTQRIAAGIGVAKGIQFLHTGMVPGIYSNCLKITDILLDSDLQVKIGKYNLPLLTEHRRLDEAETSSHGSHFCSMKSSSEDKKDIYDFGVILLEMVVGRAMISSSDVAISKDILSISLTTDATARRSIVDPTVHKECSDDSVRTLIELCIRCLSSESSERPSVEDILWNLQFAAQVQDTWIRDASSSTQESPLHATP